MKVCQLSEKGLIKLCIILVWRCLASVWCIDGILLVGELDQLAVFSAGHIYNNLLCNSCWEYVHWIFVSYTYLVCNYNTVKWLCLKIILFETLLKTYNTKQTIFNVSLSLFKSGVKCIFAQCQQSKQQEVHALIISKMELMHIIL